VKRKYGNYIAAAGFNPAAPTPARTPGFDLASVLISQESTVDPAAGPRFDPAARARSFLLYAMQLDGYGRPVWEKHNANLKEPVVTGLLHDYADPGGNATAKDNFAKMKTIVQQWPGEEFSDLNKVSIGLNRSPNPALTKKAGADAVQRAGYWDTFQILMHEYLHAAAHGNFAKDAGGGTQRHILIEGCADYFREKVWQDVEPRIKSDAALRKRVEGGSYPYHAAVITLHPYYPSIAQAKALVTEMGAAGHANLAAAYFLGHTELIGLTGSGWNASMAGQAGRLTVPAGGLTTADIATRTGLTEPALLAANAGMASGAVAAGTVVNVPGVTYHLVRAGESDSSIAGQHLIPVPALHAANPGVTWAPLAPGTNLLIPRH
jgi:hypothetical protein